MQKQSFRCLNRNKLVKPISDTMLPELCPADDEWQCLECTKEDLRIDITLACGQSFRYFRTMRKFVNNFSCQVSACLILLRVCIEN